jgi:hypothetical protein
VILINVFSYFRVFENFGCYSFVDDDFDVTFHDINVEDSEAVEEADDFDEEEELVILYNTFKQITKWKQSQNIDHKSRTVNVSLTNFSNFSNWKLLSFGCVIGYESLKNG